MAGHLGSGAAVPRRDPAAMFTGDVCRVVCRYLTGAEVLRWAAVCYHFCAEAFGLDEWEALCRGQWGRLGRYVIDPVVAGARHAGADEAQRTTAALQLKDLYMDGAPRRSWVGAFREGAHGLCTAGEFVSCGVTYDVRASVVQSGGAAWYVRVALNAIAADCGAPGGAVQLRARLVCARTVRKKKRRGRPRPPPETVILASRGQRREVVLRGGAFFHMHHAQIARHFADAADARLFVELRVGPASGTADVDAIFPRAAGAAGSEEATNHYDDDDGVSEESDSSGTTSDDGEEEEEEDEEEEDAATAGVADVLVPELPFLNPKACDFYNDPLLPDDWLEISIGRNGLRPRPLPARLRLFPNRGRSLAEQSAPPAPQPPPVSAPAEDPASLMADAMSMRVDVYDARRAEGGGAGLSLMGPAVASVKLARTDAVALLAGVAAERLGVPLDSVGLYRLGAAGGVLGPSIHDATPVPRDVWHRPLRSFDAPARSVAALAVALLTPGEAARLVGPVLQLKWHDRAAAALEHLGAVAVGGTTTFGDVLKDVERRVGAAPEGYVLQVVYPAFHGGRVLAKAPRHEELVAEAGVGVVYAEWRDAVPLLAAGSGRTLATRWADGLKAEVVIRPCPELAASARQYAEDPQVAAEHGLAAGDFAFAAALPVLRKTCTLTGGSVAVKEVQGEVATVLALPMLDVACYYAPRRGCRRWFGSAPAAQLLRPARRAVGDMEYAPVYYTFDVLRTAVAVQARAKQLASLPPPPPRPAAAAPAPPPQPVALPAESAFQRSQRLQQERDAFLEQHRERELAATRGKRLANLSERGRVLEEVHAQMQGKAQDQAYRATGVLPARDPLAEAAAAQQQAAGAAAATRHNEVVAQRLEEERAAARDACVERERQAVLLEKARRAAERARVEEDYRQQMQGKAPPTAAVPGSTTANEERNQKAQADRDAYRDAQVQKEKRRAMDEKQFRRMEKERVAKEYRLQMEAKAAAAAAGASASPSHTPATSSRPADPSKCTIQFSLPGGGTLVEELAVASTLAAVRKLVLAHRPATRALFADPANPPALLQAFPRRVFSEEDCAKPLGELGLVGRCQVVIERRKGAPPDAAAAPPTDDAASSSSSSSDDDDDDDGRAPGRVLGAAGTHVASTPEARGEVGTDVTVEMCLPQGEKRSATFPATTLLRHACAALTPDAAKALHPVYLHTLPRRPYTDTDLAATLGALGFGARQQVVAQWDEPAPQPPARPQPRALGGGRALGEASAVPPPVGGGEQVRVELLLSDGARPSGAFALEASLEAACRALLPNGVAWGAVRWFRPFPRRPYGTDELQQSLHVLGFGGRQQQVVGVVHEADGAPEPAPAPSAAPAEAEASDMDVEAAADAAELAALQAIVDRAQAPHESAEVTVQFALPDGARLQQTFPRSATLAAAKLWLLRQPAAGALRPSAISLLQAFPHTLYQSSDEGKTLAELGFPARTQLTVGKTRKRKAAG